MTADQVPGRPLRQDSSETDAAEIWTNGRAVLYWPRHAPEDAMTRPGRASPRSSPSWRCSSACSCRPCRRSGRRAIGPGAKTPSSGGPWGCTPTRGPGASSLSAGTGSPGRRRPIPSTGGSGGPSRSGRMSGWATGYRYRLHWLDSSSVPPRNTTEGWWLSGIHCTIARATGRTPTIWSRTGSG